MSIGEAGGRGAVAARGRRAVAGAPGGAGARGREGRGAFAARALGATAERTARPQGLPAGRPDSHGLGKGHTRRGGGSECDDHPRHPGSTSHSAPGANRE